MGDKLMETAYKYEYIIIVEMKHLSTANNRAKNWDPDSGGDKTFGNIRLSKTGQEPATHVGVMTRATDAMRSQILNALDNVPFAEVYSTAHDWSWDSVLAEEDLKVIAGNGLT